MIGRECETVLTLVTLEGPVSSVSYVVNLMWLLVNVVWVLLKIEWLIVFTVLLLLANRIC